MSTPSPRRVLERNSSRLYQNSYRLVPKRKFNVNNVKEKIKLIIESHLEEFEYTEQVMKDLVAQLVEEIKDGVKEERFDRYRLIISVTGGQKKMQGLSIIHSFFWDYEKDCFAEYTHESFNYFIQVVVYGVYLD